MNQQEEEMKQKITHWLNKWLRWMGIVFAVIIATTVIVVLASPSTDKKEKVEKNWWDEDLSLDAFVFAKMELEKHLKSPRGTKHPWGGSKDCVHKIDDFTYRVSCHADTPNSFNVMVRVKYGCTVKFFGKNQAKVNDFWVE